VLNTEPCEKLASVWCHPGATLAPLRHQSSTETPTKLRHAAVIPLDNPTGNPFLFFTSDVKIAQTERAHTSRSRIKRSDSPGRPRQGGSWTDNYSAQFHAHLKAGANASPTADGANHDNPTSVYILSIRQWRYREATRIESSPISTNGAENMPALLADSRDLVVTLRRRDSDRLERLLEARCQKISPFIRALILRELDMFDQENQMRPKSPNRDDRLPLLK